MAVKYFCDRCDKEKDIWEISINIQSKKFSASLCQDCIEILKDILEEFYKPIKKFSI